MGFAYLYLTYRCNNDCLFCASDRTNVANAKVELGFDECLEFMDAAVLQGHSTILINGGEPTIHRHIVEIVRAASSRFARVTVASNGIRFSDRGFAREMVKAGMNGVGIPIYSASESKFDYLVQHSGAFKEVLAGVRNLCDLKGEYDVGMQLKILVMKPNYQDNPEVIRMIQDRFPEADSIVIAGLRVGDKAFGRRDELFTHYDAARPYTSEAVRMILPRSLYLDFLPLCGLDDDLVAYLIASGRLARRRSPAFLATPDGHRRDRAQPFHCEKCCLECDVFDFCTKLHARHAAYLDYASHLRPIRLLR